MGDVAGWPSIAATDPLLPCPYYCYFTPTPSGTGAGVPTLPPIFPTATSPSISREGPTGTSLRDGPLLPPRGGVSIPPSAYYSLGDTPCLLPVTGTSTPFLPSRSLLTTLVPGFYLTPREPLGPTPRMDSTVSWTPLPTTDCRPGL